jgi:hypothetical protein
MLRANKTLVLLFASSVALLSVPLFAADKIAHVDFLVVRSYNGKPVRNASLVLHPVSKDGKQSKGGVELKTDSEGKTIAPGLQTYGDDIEINQPEHQVTIKMNRPQEQYSIYK